MQMTETMGSLNFHGRTVLRHFVALGEKSAFEVEAQRSFGTTLLALLALIFQTAEALHRTVVFLPFTMETQSPFLRRKFN